MSHQPILGMVLEELWFTGDSKKNTNHKFFAIIFMVVIAYYPFVAYSKYKFWAHRRKQLQNHDKISELRLCNLSRSTKVKSNKSFAGVYTTHTWHSTYIALLNTLSNIGMITNYHWNKPLRRMIYINAIFRYFHNKI